MNKNKTGTLCCFTKPEKCKGEWYNGTKFDMVCSKCGTPCMVVTYEQYKEFIKLSVQIVNKLDQMCVDVLSPTNSPHE